MKIVKRFSCSGEFPEDFCPTCGKLLCFVHKRRPSGKLEIYVKCFNCKKETHRATVVGEIK